MLVDDFDYLLPPERIAQQPLAQRDESRLLCLGRSAGAPLHRRFADLPRLLPPRCLLVLNDTRVLSARLHARKPSGGRVELLLLEPVPARERRQAAIDAAGDQAPVRAAAEIVARQAAMAGAGGERWRCLCRASKPLRPGMLLDIEGAGAARHGLAARVVTPLVEGEVELEVLGLGPGGLLAELERRGEMPLPPYIRRPRGSTAVDRARYQTVYAAAPGAVAAPTAGLHFTPELLAELRLAGVEIATITLHVGPGTFTPVRVATVEDHRLHAERYHIPAASLAALCRALAERRPIVAVGTTSVRTLEAAVRRPDWPSAATAAASARFAGHADHTDRVDLAGTTDLFIYPGFEFRVVDALITNFHLPRSTLLMLVSAFAGRERVLAAYSEAVAAGYRFYSYGDAMLLAPWLEPRGPQGP